jgi:hypothetical protein
LNITSAGRDYSGEATVPNLPDFPLLPFNP